MTNRRRQSGKYFLSKIRLGLMAILGLNKYKVKETVILALCEKTRSL
jgi:hypothetical protein